MGIDIAKIKLDNPTELKGTYRLIDICRRNEATGYMTNPDAFDKYLDRGLFDAAGINIMEFKSKYPLNILEMFDEYGIEGTRAILKRTVEEYRGKH